MKKVASDYPNETAHEALSKLIKQVRLIAFDFDGVFTDNTVYVFEDGREAVQCNRSDGIGLKKLKRLGIESVVISSEINPVITARCQKLGIQCIQNADDKYKALNRLLRERNISLDETAFVGNDLNDLECLKSVLIAFVVKDAHESVRKYARYTTRLPGGGGAVREICDLFESVVTGKSGLLNS